MNHLALSGLLTMATSFLLAVVILIGSPHPLPRLNALMAALNTYVAIWGLGCFLVGISPTSGVALWSWRVAHVGAIGCAVINYHLARVLSERTGRTAILISYGLGVVQVVLAMAGITIPGTRWMFGSLHYFRANAWYAFWFSVWNAIVLLGLRYLWLAYRAATGPRRRHLCIVFWAIGIGFFGGTIAVLPGFNLPWYPYSNFMVPLYALLITQLILRHQFLDVRVVITRTGVLLGTYLVVLGVPFALSRLGRAWLEQLLGNDWWVIPLGLSTTLATAGPFVYAYLRRRAEQMLMLELAETRAEASTDALTGVWARRHLLRRLEAELDKSRRSGQPCSLLMIDLDRFKHTNDTLGHLAGDQVLKTVALQLQAGLRTADVLGRYGGEEFLILLPETPRAQGHAIAERLRLRVEQTTIPAGGERHRQTLSIGLASCPDDGTSLEALIAEADTALYDAKRAGRNRVEAAKVRP